MRTVPDGAQARALIAKRIQHEKRSEFHSLGLVLGYHYEGSPIVATEPGSPPPHDSTVYHASGRPGARLPHAWLPDGRSLYDLLGPDFTLLVISANADPGPLLIAAEHCRIPVKVIDVVRFDLEGRLQAPLVLVRPDQHIAWRGDADDFNSAAIIKRACGLL